MDIKLTGTIPFTNQGWFFLLKKDRVGTAQKLYEAHSERFPSGKGFPKSNPKHMQGVIMLLANMPSDHREREIEHIQKWQISDVSNYMSVVQSWDTLTDKEKGYLSMALSSYYANETDNLIAVNLFEELYHKGINNLELCSQYPQYQMSPFFIGQLLLTDIKEIQAFALEKLTESNQIINYQSVVDMLRADGRIEFDESDNLELLIQRFREGKKFPSGRAFEVIRANKEQFVNALSIDDKVFQFEYRHQKEFAYATLLYVEKYGSTAAMDIVNKNRDKKGDFSWTTHFMDNYPHLLDGITANDVATSHFVRKVQEGYLLNMYSMPGNRVSVKHRKYTGLRIKKLSEMFNSLNFFLDASQFITNKEEYDRDAPYTNIIDYTKKNTKEPYWTLTMIIGKLHYGLMLPMELDVNTLVKTTFKSPWAFKQELKEYGVQGLFDGKMLRKIKEDTAWNTLPEISEWVNQTQVENVVSFDEMNLLF